MAKYTFPPGTKTVELKVGLYDITTSTFTATSQALVAELLDECNVQQIHLTWLSNLGNWEHFVFLGEKEYGRQFGNSRTAKRDTERFYYDIEAYEQRLISTQMITEQQAKDIATIKDAIQANILYADLSQQKILVDKDSWNYYRDRTKLTEYSFSIEFSDEKPIQNA